MTITLTDLKETIGLTAHMFRYGEWSLRQFEADTVEATEYLMSGSPEPQKITTQNQFGTLCVFMEYYPSQFSSSHSTAEYAIRDFKKAIAEHLRKDLKAKFPDQIDFHLSFDSGKNRIVVKWLVTITEV